MSPNCHKKVLSYQRGCYTKGRAPKKNDCVKGKGPKDRGVAAPLAPAGCCGNCNCDTGRQSHASARSSSSSHSLSSGPWSRRPVLCVAKALDENVTKLHILHSVQSSPISTTFSRDEKFKTSPLVPAHPSCALIKWLPAESSRTSGVVPHCSSSELRAHQMARRMSS